MNSPDSRDLLVAKSRTGRGVFASRPFSAGERIYTITGSLVTCDVDDEMDASVRDNTYRYDADRYISPDGMGNFFNHSCEPNAKVEKSRGKLHLVAHLPIATGDEVCFDYSTITARDDEWTMRCRCGTPTCRKIVRSFHTLPADIQEKYIRERIVPPYILKI